MERIKKKRRVGISKKERMWISIGMLFLLLSAIFIAGYLKYSKLYA